MYLQVKSLKDQLDTKSIIFSEKIPKRINFLRVPIETLKEHVWTALGEEQTFLSAIGKERMDIIDKLSRFEECQKRLSVIKDDMVKL